MEKRLERNPKCPACKSKDVVFVPRYTNHSKGTHYRRKWANYACHKCGREFTAAKP